MPGTHILVVDDDEFIAAALRRALEYQGYEVTLAHDGPAALIRAGRARPDLVVLDVMLPGLDGISVCERLRTESPELMVLMLTARDTTAARVAGLDAGADDYLVKPFASEELLARIRALLRRRATEAGSKAGTRLSYTDVVLDEAEHRVSRGDRPIDLTAQEFALLRCFLRHPRQVLSREQLLVTAWGLDAARASNVVDVYVGYLRTKLEAGGEPRLLHTVRGVGYALRT